VVEDVVLLVVEVVAPPLYGEPLKVSTYELMSVAA
jgi:hypothetical protein